MEFKLLKAYGFNQTVKVKNVTDNREVALGTMSLRIKSVLEKYGFTMDYGKCETKIDEGGTKTLHPTSQWNVTIPKELAQELSKLITYASKKVAYDSTAPVTDITTTPTDTTDTTDTKEEKEPVDIYKLIFG